MNFVQNLLIDSLNGFSLRFIPLLIFQLLVAGCIGYLVQLMVNKKFKSKIIERAALLAPIVALLASIAKLSLPFSVIAGSVILILGIKTKLESNNHVLSWIFIVLIGFGCGVGSIVQTVVGVMVIGMILIFIPLKPE